jgi:hypothetical protein
MAWPATDFTSRPFDKVASDLSSLCLALNQREAALGIDETRFTIPLKVWTDGEDYEIGDAVTGTDSNVYLAKTDHTASSTNEPTDGASYADDWAKEDGETWVVSTSYDVEDRVIGTNGTIYRCILAHTSANDNRPITGVLNYQTYWTVGAGRKSRPSTAELSGLVLANDGDVDDLRSIIIEAQDGSKSMVEDHTREKFTTTSGGSTFWTHSDLIDDIDITDNTGSKDFSTDFNWWDSNVWERLRQYLDTLIYCIIGPEQNGDTYFSRSASSNVSAEIAWDDTKADTPTSQNNPDRISWRIIKTGSIWDGSIRDDADFSYDTGKYSGSVIGSGKAFFTLTRDSLISATTVSIDGNNKVISSGSGTTSDETSITISLAGDTTYTAEFVTSEPASNPFNGTDDDGGVSAVRADNLTSLQDDGVRFWLDISGELTDQA